jgi:hypothetical protein
MGSNARVLLAGAAALALGGWFVAAGPGVAADDDKEASKEIETARNVILEAAKGDARAMKQAGEDLLGRKLELKRSMAIFMPRASGGLGHEPNKGKKGDGIEARFIALSKEDANLSRDAARKEGPALEKAAQVALAMTYVAEAYTPAKKAPGKDTADWTAAVKEMRQGVKEFADAAKKGDPPAIKAAARKVTAACIDCHGKFRD